MDVFKIELKGRTFGADVIHALYTQPCHFGKECLWLAIKLLGSTRIQKEVTERGMADFNKLRSILRWILVAFDLDDRRQVHEVEFQIRGVQGEKREQSSIKFEAKVTK